MAIATPSTQPSRWGAWAALCWLIFVTVRYVDTQHNALMHPVNKGADIEWAGILITLISAQIVSVLIWRARALKLWLGAGMALAAAMVLLSGAAWEVACALLLIATAMFWGEWILTRLGNSIASQLSIGETLVIAFSLGVTFLTFGGLALALAGSLTPAGVWLLTAALLIPQLGMPHPLLRRLPELRAALQADRIPAMVGLITGLVFLLNLTWSLVPEIQFDATNYHLPVASLYLQYGRIVDLPDFFHSYFAHMMDMFFALCLALGGPITVKFVVLCSGILAAGATWLLGASLFGNAVAAWAAALFYTTAVVGWLSGTAYVDGPLALFITTSILSFIKWHKTRNRDWLVITGLLLGASTAMKLQALCIVPGMAATELWLNRNSWSRTQAWRYSAVILIAVAVAAPWYATVYGFTANPAFPLYNAWFKSPLWPLENSLAIAQQFGMGTTVSGLIRIPFRMAFDAGRFGEGFPRGGLGIAILLLFPFGILMTRRDRHTLTLLFICLSYLAAWVFTFQYGRFYVPILPMIVCLGVDAFYRVVGFRRMSYAVQTCLMILVAAQVIGSPPQFWNIPERFPVFTALGMESREAFLERSLPGYDSASYLNSILEQGDRILGVETENVRFYVHGPLDSLAEATAPSPLHFISQRQPDESLARMLAVNRYRYLFVSVHSLEEAAPWYPFLNADFLRKHAQMIYADTGTRVLRLIEIPDDRSRRSSRPSTNLSLSSSR